ncbi:hypothetical protein P3W85_36640 [Cupriavidus basilensis]|uniref:Uncharacterized protein n=1 Tax=Cupriavidus basilensis TaxID=68895 RepID=A0ABT6B371_9BURK|nr:hypothetical protein [Cupriavidus basilensis]MDF3838421.1 hypothetical protein [Cupriavidus basilensis]
MTISRLPDNMGDNPWALTQNERKGITCTESPDDAKLMRIGGPSPRTSTDGRTRCVTL